MSKFHINQETGVVGRCRARQDACPFGSEKEHFDSIAEAREGYEDLMSEVTLPNAAQRGAGHTNLNRIAKDTRDPQDFELLLAKGSDRTFGNLARNPNAPGPVLVAARAKTKQESIRNALLSHPAYPVDAMSGEDFKIAYEANPNTPWGAQGKLLSDDGLKDEHLDAIGNPSDHHALSNASNNLSKEKVVSLAEKNWHSLRTAIRSGRYPFEDRVSHINMEQLSSVASELTDPLHLELAALRATEEKDESWTKHVKWAVAGNKNADEGTLGLLTESTDDTDTLVAVYNNPNATGNVRTRAAQKNKVVESLHRVTTVAQHHNGDLNSAMGRQTEEVGTLGRERVIKFDPERVHAIGFTPTDVDTVVRYFQGNYLFSAKYDPASGRYSGWID